MRVDTHCHILYGVDDASKTAQQSLEMLKMAVADGVDVIMATSHIHYKFPLNNSARFDAAVAQVHALIKEHHLPIRVIKAGEIYFAHETEGTLDDDRLITMGDSRCVLTELPWRIDVRDTQPEVVLQALLDRGYQPIIAHPERYEVVHEDYERLYRWKEMGCLLQVNRTSLLGVDFMAAANVTAQRILADDLLDVVGSDAHRTTLPRVPILSDVHELLVSQLGKQRADELCGDTARKLFNL